MSLSCGIASLLICIKMWFSWTRPHYGHAHTVTTPTPVTGNHQIKMSDFQLPSSCKIAVYGPSFPPPRQCNAETVLWGPCWDHPAWDRLNKHAYWTVAKPSFICSNWTRCSWHWDGLFVASQLNTVPLGEASVKLAECCWKHDIHNRLFSSALMKPYSLCGVERTGLLRESALIIHIKPVEHLKAKSFMQTFLKRIFSSFFFLWWARTFYDAKWIKWKRLDVLLFLFVYYCALRPSGWWCWWP